ncbi:hypothetical protein I203_102372 [Kwoniella mangroviensis CBS 8507]|uniref:uncharacterized protein n=1 Tax=Kwoniella mangroviensis CBS 8507 TaxID=1296122 RepID=UPI003021DC38
MGTTAYHEHDDREKGDMIEPQVIPHAPDEPVIHTKDLDAIKDKNYDVGAEYFAELAQRADAHEIMAPWTEAEEKSVLRKLDMIVLPLVTMSLMMGGIDKVILGTSASFGVRTDLHLVGQEYSWRSSIIFFGSILTEFLQSWLIQKLLTGKVFSFNVFMFGIMTFATMGVKNAGGLQAVRFILGMFEGMNTSGAGLVIGMWWKKEEQGVRTVIVLNTLSSVVNGLLSYAVQFYTPTAHLSRWQLLFLITACISVTFGILDWIFFPSNPTKAWWLTERQRYIAVARLTGVQTGMVNTHTKWNQVKEALLDVRTWLYFLISITLNIPNGGLSGFYSIVVANLHFSTKQLTLMNMPTGPIGCLSLLIGTVVLKVVPHSNIGGSLAGLYIVYMYWAPYMVYSQLMMYRNVGGTTKKVAVFGISYLGYAVGNLVGPQSFRAKEDPSVAQSSRPTPVISA